MLPTIHTAAVDIRAGRLSPVELLDSCLHQIDRHEERVRAWVLVDRDGARAEAKRLGDELKYGHYRGPLHGIPIGVKDIYDVFDWPTAAGSRRWANSIARQDAPVVQRLRHAGAVLLGKTVTTQYASFDPSPTRNPWHPGRTPGGSSSGSAAAVACGMCLGALASQTGGSITRPASYCGAAGLKPTYGRVPLDGIVPLAPSMDHPGPIAGCVCDLAILLAIMAGPAPGGPTFLDRLSLPGEAVQPPRLGRLFGLFDERAEQPVRNMIDRVCTLFRDRQATVSAVSLPASFAEVLPRHRTIMAVEAAAFHEPRLRKYPDDYALRIRGLLEEGLACPAPEYARCKAHQQQLTQEMLHCFQGVDVLLCPATTDPAPAADTTGDPAFNSPWSYTGLPTVSFLAGWSPDGLPLGLQLVGRPWAEAELLAAAAWCESALALEKREPPT
jgi:aspartyl-tRNA(Asn)/glutamyl-tRNA(Gln) amidotransferase subunit A